MKQLTKSIIAVIILLTLFSFSIYKNSNNEITTFCKGNTTCIINLAKETGDFNLCENSLNIEEKQICYEKLSFLTKNPVLCENTQNQSYCYTYLAVNLDNIILCQKTENNDKCIFETAIKNNNYNYCYQTNNPNLCIYSYAVQKKDLALCNNSGKYNSTCASKIK